MVQRFGACCCVGLAWGVAAFAGAQSQPITLSGTVENYLVAGAKRNGIQHRQTWTQLVADINEHLRLVATNQQEIDENYVDETYAQFEFNGNLLRVGKLRTPFGFSAWNELNYTGLIDLPMIRTEDEAPDLGLYDLHSGVEATLGGPRLQVQASMVDTGVGSRQILPAHMDHGFLRLQASEGSVIVGVSALKQVTGIDPDDEKFYGVDIRWTAPQWQLRGEYVKADSSGSNSSRGGYVDVFYRIPGSTTTRLVARAEEFKGFESGQTARHEAVGIRQVLNQYFTLSVNYGASNHVAPGDSLTGWSAQLMTSIHF